MYYFAYGSNLNRVQMQSRCLESVPVAKAKLKGYRLNFNRVADIVEDKNSEVWGAVYTVSPGDIESLDLYEGYPRLYDKVGVKVIDERGKTYEAFAYLMTSKGSQEPSEGYYRIIEEGYQDWDLDKKLLQRALQESHPSAHVRPSGLKQQG